MQNERQEFPQLNPFAFPSETKGRFSMLIVAALVCGSSLGNIVHAAFIGNYGTPSLSSQLEAVIQLWWGKKITNASTNEIVAFVHQQLSMIRGILLFCVEVLALPLIFALLIGALAVYFYKSHTKRLRLLYKPQPITRAEAPKLMADLERYAERFGLRLPRLEYSPGLAQGHAFGEKGNEVLLLHGTPSTLESSWGDENRAIALHELGHVANADTQEREKASGVWKGFIIVVMGVLLLLGLFGVRLRGEPLIRMIAVLLFLRALWAGLIRTREFYADWRAVSWGAGPALTKLLELKEGRNNPWERWNWWWKAWERWGEAIWWRALWPTLDWGWQRLSWILRLHPSFRRRREVLEDASHLFRITPDLPLLTGVLMSVVIAGSLLQTMGVLMTGGALLGLIHSVALLFVAGLAPSPMRELLLVGTMVTMEFLLLALITSIILVPSYFVTRTIGVQLQRNAVARLAIGERKNWGYGSLLPTAFLLALGMEAGLHITPFNPLISASRESWAASPIWLIGFTLLLWLWLAYVHGVSRMLLGSHTGERIPRARQNLIAVSSTILLAILYWPAILARLTLQVVPMVSGGVQLPFGMESRKVFIYGFFMTALVVLVLAVIAYFVWVLLSLAALRYGPLRRRKHCRVCREEVFYMLSLGRRCQGCGEVLSSWIFLGSPTAKPEVKL